MEDNDKTVPQPRFDLDAQSLERPVMQPLSAANQSFPNSPDRQFIKKTKPLLAVLMISILLIGGGFVLKLVRNQPSGAPAGNVAANQFETVRLPLSELLGGKSLNLAGTSVVTINGSMQLNGSFTLTPALQPTGAKPGQLYFDQTTSQLAYYNGSGFVFLTDPRSGVVQSLGGATGQLTVGSGLTLADNQLANGGVLSVQGQNGAVTLTPGAGILINGTTFSNSGVLSVVAGTPNVTVQSVDGTVTISVDTPIAGTGTVTSSGGTAGTIPVFTVAQNVEDSIITQAGLAVTVGGDLSVSGNLNAATLSLATPLSVANGGTGANSLAANGVLVGQGASAISSIVAGGAGLCLLSTGGAPAWGACPSGSGGVTSLNSLNGALSIANASAAGSTITIDDASTSAKGIASFNATNFSVAGGAVNTIQNINTGASPTFTGVNTNNITPSGTLTIGAAGQQLILQGNSSTSLSANNGLNSTIVGFQAPTANVTYRFLTTAAGTYDICTTAANCVGLGGSVTTGGGTTNRLSKFSGAQSIADSTITDNGTTVTTSVDLVIQGGDVTVGIASSQTGSINFAQSGSAFLGTVVQGALSGNRSYTLPDASGTFCLSSGNCPASGVTSLNGLAGALSIANASAAGSTITIDDATTIAKGIASFNGTNFSVASGAVNTIQNINTGATPTFAGVNTNSITPSSALTIGAVGQTLLLQGNASTTLTANNGGNATAVSFQSPTANVTYRFLTTAAGTYDICTTAANCTGVGGGVTTSGGTTNRLSKFSGTQTIADSSITDNGTNVLTSIDLVIQGGDLTVGVPTTQTGTINLAHSGSAFLGSILQGALSADRTYTLPDASGTICLSSGNCAGGVTSLNGLVGALSIANASAAGSTITINDATTGAKGIASFNSNNFSVASGAVNTIQDIHTTATPTFSGVNTNTITPSGALTVGATSQTALLRGSITTITSTGAGNDIILTSADTIELQSSTNVTGNIDVSGTLTSGTANAFQVAAGGDITTAGNATVQGGTVTAGTSSQAGSFVINDGSSNTGALQVAPLGQNTTYTLPDPGGASATVCLTSGNCAGVGGGVTTAGGSTNRLAKFSGAQSIADSTITDNGTTVTTTVDLVIQGGDVTVGTSSQLASLLLHDGNGQTTTIQAGDSSGNLTFILPTNAGSANQCLKQSGTGNQLVWDACDGGGGGSSATLQAAYNNGNSITTTDNRDIDIVLADTSTDSNFDLVVADGGTGFVSFSRANGAGTADPAQLLLINNLDADRALPIGVKLQAAGGGMTTAIDATDAEIVDAINVAANNIVGTTGNIDFTNFDVAGGSGDITTAGNLAVNGGSITSTAGLTLTSAGGGNITLNSAGTVELQDNTNVTGNVDASGTLTAGTANAFQVAAGGGITSAGNATLQGGVVTIGTSSQAGTLVLFDGSSNTGTLQTAALGQNTVYTLPDPGGASATICLSTGNCAGASATLQAAYDSSTSPEIVVDGTRGALTVRDSSGGIGANLLEVQNNAGSTTYFGVTTSGISVTGTATSSGNINTSGGSLLTGGTIRIDNSGNATNIGAITLSGAISGGTTYSGSGNINTTGGVLQTNSTTRVDNSGNLTNIGNLTATGAITIASTGAGNDIVINGADVFDVQDATTFASTVGFNGVATFNSDLTANGNVSLGDAAADTLTIAATLQGSSPLVFEGAAADANELTLSIASLTGDQTITLPDETGTVCLQNSANCGFALTSGSTSYIQNQSAVDQTADFRISGTGRAGTALQAPLFDTATGVALGIGTSNATNITVGSTTSTSTLTLGQSTASNTVNIGNATTATGNTQTVNIGTSATGTGKAVVTIGNTNAASALTLQAGTGNITLLTNSASASVVVRSGTNGAAAFQVQNASSLPFLTADTSGNVLTLGNVTATVGQGVAGSLRLADGTNDNFGATLNTTTLTASRTISLPDEAGTICLQSSTNCGFAAASGSANYIQNQNASDQTANFRISGTGRATTSFQAPAFDTATAVTLTIGGTNATGVDLANNSATHTVNIATASGAAQTVTMGSTNAGSTTTIQGGTGSSAVSVQAGSSGTILIGTANSNVITVGNAGTTSTLTLGQSTASNTINVGNATTATGNTQTINIATSATGTGKAVVTIGNGNGASSLALQAGTGGLSITTQGTGTLGVGNNAVAQTIAIGNGTGATAVSVLCGTGTCGFGNNATDHSTTLGSSTGTSLTTMQGGTGGILLTAGSGGNIVLGTSDTTGTLLVLDTKTNFTAAQTSDPTGMAGGMYYNSATGAFRCYEVDHWRDCLVSARSSYHRVFELGADHWTGGGELFAGSTNGGGNFGLNTGGETGHPSIVSTTVDAVGSFTYFGSPGDNEIRLGNNDYWRHEAAVRIPTLSTATQRYISRAGFLEGYATGDGSDGCFFKYSDNVNSGKWQGVCLTSTTASTCDTTITVATSTWYRLTVVVNAAGNSADFRINGTSRCTVTTNIPTGSTNQTGRGVFMEKTVGTTGRDMHIDYLDIEGQFGTPR